MLSVAVGERGNVVSRRRVRLCATRGRPRSRLQLVAAIWRDAAICEAPRLAAIHLQAIARPAGCRCSRVLSALVAISTLTERPVARNVNPSSVAIDRHSSTSASSHVDASSGRSFGAAQKAPDPERQVEGRSRLEKLETARGHSRQRHTTRLRARYCGSASCPPHTTAPPMGRSSMRRARLLAMSSVANGIMGASTRRLLGHA